MYPLPHCFYSFLHFCENISLDLKRLTHQIQEKLQQFTAKLVVIASVYVPTIVIHRHCISTYCWEFSFPSGKLMSITVMNPAIGTRTASVTNLVIASFTYAASL
jgi:hypothetical protein